MLKIELRAAFPPHYWKQARVDNALVVVWDYFSLGNGVGYLEGCLWESQRETSVHKVEEYIQFEDINEASCIIQKAATQIQWELGLLIQLLDKATGYKND